MSARTLFHFHAWLVAGAAAATAVGASALAEAQETHETQVTQETQETEETHEAAPAQAAEPQAPAPAAASEPSAPSEPPPASPKRKARFAFEVAPGFSYDRIFDVGIAALDLEGGAGITRGRFSVLLTGTYFRGSTSGHLGARGGKIGPEVDFAVVERLHLGGGVVGTYLEIDRASSPGATLWQLGAGVFGAVTLDLVPIEDDHAVFVRARFDAVGYASDDKDPRGGSGGPLVWGPTLSLGFRF